MISKDPKQFWKNLNNWSSVYDPNIPIDSLFELFKTWIIIQETDHALVDHSDGNNIDVTQPNHKLNN